MANEINKNLKNLKEIRDLFQNPETLQKYENTFPPLNYLPDYFNPELYLNKPKFNVDFE